MESPVEIVLTDARSVEVGEKRPAENDGEVSKKKIKKGASFAGDVKKVAEMVLVLAAMGKMRGGKGPLDVEKEVMAEARNALANICQDFVPKDVFPRDAFGGVIDDLGINKLKEQKLGFRAPKISIAQKLLLSKRKMEKAEDFLLPSTPHSSQHLPVNTGAATENRGAPHPVRTPQLSHTPTSSGSFQSGLTTSVNSTSAPYQLPTSEIRPMVSSALSSAHLGSAPLPRVNHPQLRSDARSNGSSHPPPVQANYSANSTLRTPAWSVQSHHSISSDNKVPVKMDVKFEDVKSGLARQATATPPQGTNYVQAPPPIKITHVEVGKIVQKLLQPRVSVHPMWTPPSRDYMNKPLNCHMCMSTVTEMDNVLICDSCEKGYHLKCLQTTSQKGLPKGEWNCGKCLSLSNGKPLPPKYGRVMRNTTPQKASSSSEASSTSKKVGASDENKVSSGTYPNNSAKNSSSAFVEISSNDGDSKKISNDEASTQKKSLENREKSKESHGGENINNNANQVKKPEIVYDTAGVMDQVRSSSHGLNAVDWVGNPIQVLDEKMYYASCRINEHVHKVQDHVLIRFDNDKLIPSKLQAMWEDKNTGMKWVTINRCYFAGDLPEAVGRPCGLESDEVYESNFGLTMLAGLIKSPCEVLPPRKFAEESERRNRSKTQMNDHMQPLYLCKWIYDESKGLFRDISC